MWEQAYLIAQDWSRAQFHRTGHGSLCEPKVYDVRLRRPAWLNLLPECGRGSAWQEQVALGSFDDLLLDRRIARYLLTSFVPLAHSLILARQDEVTCRTSQLRSNADIRAVQPLYVASELLKIFDSFEILAGRGPE